MMKAPIEPTSGYINKLILCYRSIAWVGRWFVDDVCQLNGQTVQIELSFSARQTTVKQVAAGLFYRKKTKTTSQCTTVAPKIQHQTAFKETLHTRRIQIKQLHRGWHAQLKHSHCRWSTKSAEMLHCCTHTDGNMCNVSKRMYHIYHIHW